MQEDLQKLPPGFPRGAVPQPPFPTLAPTMGQMHTLMPTQSLQPTQQLEYKVQSVVLDLVCGHQKAYGRHLYIHVKDLNINFTVFSLQIWLPVFAPSGAVLAAATYSAATQRHGASWSKSFRWWGQHSTTRSAPQEAPGALATCHQPGEDLDFCVCILSVLLWCKLKEYWLMNSLPLSAPYPCSSSRGWGGFRRRARPGGSTEVTHDDGFWWRAILYRGAV